MLPTPSPMKVQTDSFTAPTSTLPKLTSQHWASTLADCQLQCCTLFTVVLQTRSSILAEALTVRLMPSGLGGGYIGIMLVLISRSLLPLVLFLVFLPVEE